VQPSRSPSVRLRAHRVAGESLSVVQTARNVQARLRPSLAAQRTPLAGPRHMSSPRLSCRLRWRADRAVASLQGDAIANQRRGPLLRCSGTPRAAGFVAARPQAAAGADRAGASIWARRRRLRGRSGGRSWCRCAAPPSPGGGGSAASGAATKRMQLATARGGEGRRARRLARGPRLTGSFSGA
jgi:hypothetical protein